MDTTTRMFDDVKFRSANNNDRHQFKAPTNYDDDDDDFWTRNHDVVKPSLHKNDPVKLYNSASPENDEDDDDVFAPDDPEDGLSKPLMYPRQRTKVKTIRPAGKSGKCLRCAGCIVLFVGLMAAAGVLIVYVHSVETRQSHLQVCGTANSSL